MRAIYRVGEWYILPYILVKGTAIAVKVDFPLIVSDTIDEIPAKSVESPILFSIDLIHIVQSSW